MFDASKSIHEYMILNIFRLKRQKIVFSVNSFYASAFSVFSARMGFSKSTRFPVVDRTKFKKAFKRIENNSEIWTISEIHLIGFAHKKHPTLDRSESIERKGD